jgi:hypothetical protein
MKNEMNKMYSAMASGLIPKKAYFYWGLVTLCVDLGLTMETYETYDVELKPNQKNLWFWPKRSADSYILKFHGVIVGGFRIFESGFYGQTLGVRGGGNHDLSVSELYDSLKDFLVQGRMQ